MIESATEADLPEVRSLLERLGLPLEGVGDHLTTMLSPEKTDVATESASQG